jgi:hypothetical protein
VERLTEVLELPGGRWLEPAAGDGAIVRAVTRGDVSWDLWELRESERESLARASPGAEIHIGDFLADAASGRVPRGGYAVAITNPPFRIAQPFIDSCLECAEVTVMLLRLNFLASKGRWEFMSKRAPDVYVLPNRPSFVGGRTDSIEYAWFVWGRERRKEGRIRVLGLSR